jgi:hypothetical protein
MMWRTIGEQLIARHGRRASPVMPRACALVLAGTLSAATLRAQDESDSTAYRALTQTPLDAFSPVVGPALTARRPAGLSFNARYGLQSFRSEDYVHNVGVGVEVPLAAGRLGVTAGYYGPACSLNDCPGHFIASLDYEQGLVSLPLGRPEQSGSLNLGLKAGVGLGWPDDATLVSGAASLRVALVPRSGSARIFPFLAPGVGVGLVDGDSDAEAGMLPTFAGGVGLLAWEDRLGVIVGIDRVFLSDGNWVAGISLAWNLEH